MNRVIISVIRSTYQNVLLRTHLVFSASRKQEKKGYRVYRKLKEKMKLAFCKEKRHPLTVCRLTCNKPPILSGFVQRCALFSLLQCHPPQVGPQYEVQVCLEETGDK